VQPMTSQRRGSPVAFGLLLVVVGVVMFAGRVAGFDFGALLGEDRWPLLIIVPGLALLAVAVVPVPPNGVGFAIGGSIVTTVGLILFYQETTSHWESWAYGWALIPGASGFGLAAYGLATRHHEFLGGGLRLILVAAVLFTAGLWFFETTFATGRAPVDLGDWWPMIIIAIGLLIAVNALVTGRSTGREIGDGASPGNRGEQS
jgi:hypothetical protein